MNAPDLMHTLAWSLLHFLWQGAAIAALAAALMFLFRKPATRYLLGVSALVLMLLSFGVTFTLLSAAGGGAAATTEWAPAAALVSPQETASPTMPWTERHAATDSSLDFAWLARGWLVGVFVLALRIAFGLLVLEQLRRRNLLALPDSLVRRFQALQAQLGISRVIRYSGCRLVPVPAVIGFFRPVVLVPMRALTGLTPEQLEALVAHELGHIKRFDVAVNFFQVIAETLFFFHPAVWWLNKRIRADREDCCDDIAVAAGGSSVTYARALATIVDWTQRRDVPEFAMAATAGPVAARIARLLGIGNVGGGARSAGVVTASLVLAGALFAGAVSLGLAQPAQAQAEVSAPVPVSTPVSPPAAPSPVAPPNPPAPVAQAAPAARAAPAAKPTPAARPAAAARPGTPVKEPRNSGEPTTSNTRSFIEEMRSVDLGDLEVEELIQLKTHNINSEYIREMRATGLDLQLDQIVAMKVHDVTPAYIQQVRNLKLAADVDEIIAFKVHQVSPEYVQQIRALGFEVGADEVVAMKIHGIDAQYVKSMRELGLDIATDEIIALKVHDVTPEYVRQMRASGFEMTTDEVINMKIHGVTPEYRKMLESAGFKPTTEEMVQGRIFDITPEFIARVKAQGFKDLKFRQLIALKNADIL